MPVKVYISSISGSRLVKEQQKRIKNVLDTLGIEFEEIDIANTDDRKAEMRELANDPKAIPPQIFNNDRYLGDYDAFWDAVEDKKVKEFLGIE